MIVKELERSPSVDTPFSALAFKIMTDPFVGRLTFLEFTQVQYQQVISFIILHLEKKNV